MQCRIVHTFIDKFGKCGTWTVYISKYCDLEN